MSKLQSILMVLRNRHTTEAILYAIDELTGNDDEDEETRRSKEQIRMNLQEVHDN